MLLARLLSALILATVPLLAQPGGFDPEKSVAVTFAKGVLTVAPPPGAHLKETFMKVELASKGGRIAIGKMTPPNAKDELGDPIWQGPVQIPITGEGLKDPVQLAVTYQPCTEGEGGVCYPPTTRKLAVKAAEVPAIATGPAAAKAAPAAQAAPDPLENGTVQPMPPAGTAAAMAPANPTPAPSEPFWWGLLAAFGWGLVAAFSPCVYPMIPITLAIVGARGGGRLKGLFLSLLLVLGMAVTYMTLAVATAKLGGVFGAFAQRPGFLVPVSILFAVFAVSLFGAFEIRLPASWQSKLQSGAHAGWAGAFVMGLVLGPISAPCVGPYFGTLLTTISQQGQVGIGALKAFIFALGMGSLFIAVGGFSAALPKSGDWLDRLKHIMGVVVLGFAAWNVRLIVPEWANFAMWTVVALTAAATFGAFEAAEGFVAQLRKGLALLLLACGVLLGLRALEGYLNLDLLPKGGTASAPKDEHAGWMIQDYEGAQKKAKAENKLVLIDIYADWCAQCKELDEKTWPDPAVKAWIAKNAVAVRIDTDARRKDLAGPLKIQSYPTVILADAEGRELRRLLGFHKPEGMLKFLQGS